MSETNAELGPRIVDAFNRGDVDAVIADMHPEVEFIPRRATIQGSYHGHGGLRKFFADNDENFDLFHVTQDEVRDLGDRVVGIGTLRIRGKGSGVEVTVPTAVVLTLTEGKVIRFEEFGDRAKALAAAGVEA
jgi:ketosteroid isomerase-like protein